MYRMVHSIDMKDKSPRQRLLDGAIDYVSHHGFGLFAWWRIIVGALGLIALGIMG